MFGTLDFFLNCLFFSKNCLICFFIDQTNLIPFFTETKICIILSQQKTIFCTACHHSIRFMVFFCNQVIDQYSNISFGTVQNQLFPAFYLHSCIDSGNQPLCCCFFISGASVKLSATEQAFDLFEFQRRIQLPWIDAVILNCIGVLNNLCMFQSRNRMVHFILYIFRKRTGHTSNIHFIRIKSFWFNKYLMTFFIRKTNDLVLDRWTVSRSSTFNHTGIQWRTVQIITDDLMRFFVCISQPAGLLLDLYRLRIR